MHSKRFFLAAAGLTILPAITLAQGRGAAPPPPTDTVAPDIPGVVAGGAKVHVIKDGFNGSEGTIALPDGSVIFSETTANRTIKIDKDDNVTTFLENTAGSNGMSFDRDGRLFVTQVPFGAGGIAILYPAAARRMLIDNYDGKPFGRANDLTVARNGGVYFTDSANAQPMPAAGVPLPPALYYLAPGAAKATQLLTDVPFPNGVVLSRDEKTLYLNNTNGEYLLAFDVQADGTVKNRAGRGHDRRRRWQGALGAQAAGSPVPRREQTVKTALQGRRAGVARSSLAVTCVCWFATTRTAADQGS